MVLDILENISTKEVKFYKTLGRNLPI